MASFAWAVKQLQKGKKVRRDSWWGFYLSALGGPAKASRELVFETEEGSLHHIGDEVEQDVGEGKRTIRYYLYLEDVAADDWMIYS